MVEQDPQRLLYMAEDAGSGTSVQEVLEKSGYLVDVVTDGQEGLAACEQTGYDVATIEYNLPSVHGLAVIHALGSKGLLPPTIMVVNPGSEVIAAEALRMGADDYIIKDAQGGFLHLVRFVVKQVLDHRRLEEAAEAARSGLTQSERRFKTFAESAKDILWMLDLNLKYTYVSPSVRNVLGYDVDEIMRLNPLEILTPESKHRVLKALLDELEIEKKNPQERAMSRTEEIAQYHKDGSLRSFEVTAAFLRDDVGRPAGILGMSRDITSRKAGEDALRESESKFRMLVEESPVGIVLCDTDGRVTDLNPAVLSILDSPVEEAKEFINLLTFTPLVETRVSSAIRRCLETGQANMGEFPYRSKRGRQIYTRVHVVPLRSADNATKGAQVVIEDITDQKRAEGLRVRSERLKAVVAIADGVAHNFNTSLRSVSADAQMALTSMDARNFSEARDLILKIRDSVHTSVQTVRRLQQFAGARSVTMAPQSRVFDLSDSVKEGVEKRKLWWRPDTSHAVPVTVKLDLQPDCMIAGEEDELVEVVVNLLKNAAEALAIGGEMRVRTYTEGDQVILQVQDEGEGIPKEDLEKMFEPFWTTKSSHSGMGLSVSLGIIRRHRGRVTVSSRVGVGTTIIVGLPRVEQQPAEIEPMPKDFGERKFRILLIDDDEHALRLIEKGLKRLGQTTFVAFTGQQGLKLFEEEEVDAVVCDLAMPGMSGWEVSRSLRDICARKACPVPPFIMLTERETGPAGDEIRLHPDVDRVVEKPVKVSQLLEIVDKEIKGALTQAAFSGSIYGIDILEYVQLLLFTGQQVVLEILSKDGLRGLLFIDKGEIPHAVCGDMEGEEALYQCLTFKGGNFSSLPWREPECVTINKRGEFMLMEAARQRDGLREAAKESVNLL
ncbi:MAG: PAS domain S-box protein [Pseudomonadota bacterium]